MKTELTVITNLGCRYTTGHHPFLILQPVKVEQVSIEPLIAIYHDVISDDEINTIKKLALPKVAKMIIIMQQAKIIIQLHQFIYLQFTRADVHNPFTSDVDASIKNYRISKIAWLEVKDHEHVFKV